MSVVLGWVCLGLASAFVVSIWPPHRLGGLILNGAAAVTGAVAGGELGLAFRATRELGDPRSLMFAVFGAFACLLLAHAAWRAARAARHSRRHG